MPNFAWLDFDFYFYLLQLVKRLLKDGICLSFPHGLRLFMTFFPLSPKGLKVTGLFKLPRMKIIPFLGCLGMVPPRSCFRIVIAGPARGAQALFTVGPALISLLARCFSSQCVTRAGMPTGWFVLWRAGAVARRGAVGGGRGRPVFRQEANEERRRWGAAERRHANAKRSIFLTKSAQLRQLSAGGRAGEQPSRPGAGGPHGPAPPAAVGNRGSRRRTPIPAPSRPAGARGPGRALARGPR